MNTEKRKAVVEIDAALAALRAERIPSANWRRIRAKSAALARLRDRRHRLTRRADFDDGPTPF